jgi:mannitol-1-phosphate/altronate dehydrogenase
MKKKILFMGSGAIGRGYLPWALDDSTYEFIFIDRDPYIVDLLKQQGTYATYRVKGKDYERKQVLVSGAYLSDDFIARDHADAVACFFSVGPRNVLGAAAKLAGTQIPLILCENDPDTVATAKRAVGHDRVYFAVPDVITSNTAPDYLLADDPLAISTEDGVLFVEEGSEPLHGDLKYVSTAELLRMQWTPKLFLHNTPHCIAAYLGALMGKRYLHEAMVHPKANAIVEGAMEEMLQALKLQWDIPHEFLDWYAEKELQRFRCELLCDPVARVAREPLRKLELKGRLIGAAQMCLTLGVLPQNLLTGIVSALMFDDENDQDHHIALMRDAMGSEHFNRYVIGLRSGEPLDLMLREKTQAISTELQVLAAVTGSVH